MKGKTKEKYRLKLWVRVGIFTTFVFIMAISSFIIYIGRHPSMKRRVNYNYSIDEKLDYQVYLKENDFYEEKFLGEGKQYATEIIDYINLDFNYNFNGSSIADIDYSYDITATIIGEYENTTNGNAELWKKNYVIKNLEEKNIEKGTSFNINENIKIDYSKYSKVVESFISKFRIPIDAYLDVKLNVVYSSELGKNTGLDRKRDQLEIKIPLAKTTIKIDKNIKEHRTEKLNNNDLVEENKPLIRFGLGLCLISLAIFLLLSPQVFISSKTYYEKTLKKIMRDYAEIIVEVDFPPDPDGVEVIDVKNFDDMVDIEEEIKSPILYYEIEKDAESLFTITTDKYIYKYNLRK